MEVGYITIVVWKRNWLRRATMLMQFIEDLRQHGVGLKLINVPTFNEQ